MSYLFNTQADQQEMLKAIGAESIDELFAAIPEELRLGRELNIPAALGELELTQHMSTLAAKNSSAADSVCFLGGGSYDHFIPAVVDALASRGEFFTSYTPYQPEVAQGNLQAMFEYQTLICQLTEMDVSNASVYDGGSALAEAVLMSQSVTRRHKKVVITDSVHPEYRQILGTYLANFPIEIATVSALSDDSPGTTDIEQLAATVDDQTACVVVQHPNFFGSLEDVKSIAAIAHDAGAKVVAVVDPTSLGLLQRPGAWGADIVVAEGQSLGNPLQFGGPYLGIMACREEFIRRMPGRIAGETVDRRGKRCYVLTLQTREQHIRRDKATSNICTNQGLLALRSTIYLAAMGPHGMRELGEICLRRAHYAAERIASQPRFDIAFASGRFKEFVVRDHENQVDALLADARGQGYMAGIPLGRWYPSLSDCFLVAVTEKRTRQQIDGLADVLHASREGLAPLHA